MTDPILPAEIQWQEGGLPTSTQYGDVYFSSEGGLAEARHVFLDGNHLTKRLAKQSRFTVGEIGFGSGLNFLALWQLWEQIAPKNARLHFFSVEKHPLTLDDMARIHAHFPEIKPYAIALRAALPFHTPGFHRVYLAGGRIQLTLMYGDGLDMLRQQNAATDAWFLDGFAPRLNPDLWSHALLQDIRRLSAPNATLATFSTATHTLDAVSGAGFSIEKTQGFGRKKNMLTAHLRGEPKPPKTIPRITIIGAGLAGAATAHAFALRGVMVDVLETAAQAAAGASANPSAIFYPGITLGWQEKTQLYFAGMAYTRYWLQQLSSNHSIAQNPCGMLWFAKPEDKPHRTEQALKLLQPDARALRPVDTEEACTISGIKLPEQDALFFPQSGWVNVADLTHALLNHPLITLHNNHIFKHADVNEGNPTILCNGVGASTIIPALEGQIQRVRGQVSHLPPPPNLHTLKTVLCYGGYVTPTIHGLHHVGATYEHWRDDLQVDALSHTYNLDKLGRFMGTPVPATDNLGGWAAFRSVSRDRLPMVGMWNDTLACNLAHGSRGLLTCLLSGEYLASTWLGEPLPIGYAIADIMNVQRFGITKNLS